MYLRPPLPNKAFSKCTDSANLGIFIYIAHPIKELFIQYCKINIFSKLYLFTRIILLKYLFPNFAHKITSISRFFQEARILCHLLLDTCHLSNIRDIEACTQQCRKNRGCTPIVYSLCEFPDAANGIFFIKLADQSLLITGCLLQQRVVA